jgi:hypothetical protein
MIEPLLRPVDPLPQDLPGGEYEYRLVVLPRPVGGAQAQRLLAELAEHGHWEVARVRLYWGGARRVWLRRRIIRVVRTA